MSERDEDIEGERVVMKRMRMSEQDLESDRRKKKDARKVIMVESNFEEAVKEIEKYADKLLPLFDMLLFLCVTWRYIHHSITVSTTPMMSFLTFSDDGTVFSVNIVV